MTTFSRRGFLAASAAMLAASHFPIRAYGQDAAAIRLAATSRTLDIDNRPATVFGLTGPNGQGLLLDPGERFRVDLTNDLAESTIIHWHGQIPPNAQDGVPICRSRFFSPVKRAASISRPSPERTGCTAMCRSRKCDCSPRR